MHTCNVQMSCLIRHKECASIMLTLQSKSALSACYLVVIVSVTKTDKAHAGMCEFPNAFLCVLALRG